MHAIIRTHHLNFHVRFWPISAFMSKTIQSKSNLTLCTFSDTCVWSFDIVSNCISDPESFFTQNRLRRLSLSSSLPWRELKHGVRFPRRLPTWVKLQSNKSHCTRRHFFQVAMGNSKDPHQARITWMITELNPTKTGVLWPLRIIYYLVKHWRGGRLSKYL